MGDQFQFFFCNLVRNKIEVSSVFCNYNSQQQRSHREHSVHTEFCYLSSLVGVFIRFPDLCEFSLNIVNGIQE